MNDLYREGKISRALYRCKLDIPLLAAGSLIEDEVLKIILLFALQLFELCCKSGDTGVFLSNAGVFLGDAGVFLGNDSFILCDDSSILRGDILPLY